MRRPRIKYADELFHHVRQQICRRAQAARNSADVPVIYVNDNIGQWRSDFRRTVAHCMARSSRGRTVSARLTPRARDYFVLKPKHSGFYHTTLETLLDELKIEHVLKGRTAESHLLRFQR